MSEDLTEQLEAAVRHLRAHVTLEPRVLIAAGPEVLASVGGAVEEEEALPYASVPSFPAEEGADSGLCAVLGRWGGTPVVVVPGAARHAPCALRRATLPVRAFRRLGAEVLVALDGCVPTAEGWGAGELALIDDHINLLGDNPLVGPNDESLGTRFPDMSEAYDRALGELVLDAADRAAVKLRRAVYAAVRGGARPTPAERHMLCTLGADIVGEGVVQDVIVARHMGMRVLALAAVDGHTADMVRTLSHVVGRLA